MVLTNHMIYTMIMKYIHNIFGECDAETDRETVIEQLDEACDNAFGEMVQASRIDEYTCDDLVATAAECAAIIKFAEENAWVEDDAGLWEGLTYGVLASVAYSSLRNCLYEFLRLDGVDSNDDFPFAEKDE